MLQQYCGYNSRSSAGINVSTYPTRPLEELGKSRNRKSRSFEDKETCHWYRGMTEVNKNLGTGIQKIHVADREADV